MSDIRVYLLEGQMGDARFVLEALAELEETTHGGAWLHCKTTHFERLEEALIVIAEEAPDVVLFNPNLPDCYGLETFVRLRDTAPAIPLIALVEEFDQGLGRRMVREGAQDFLLKQEIDCRPLARSMMNAIERHRFIRAALRHIRTDPETGLLNRAGFEETADRERVLARECGRNLSLVLAELDALGELDEACGRMVMHETVREAGNTIRNAAGETALPARIGLARFGVLAWNDTPERMIGSVQQQLAVEHQQFAFVFGHARIDMESEHGVAEALKAAEERLCENKLAYSSLP
jgi:PleD family two-component response regulator